MFLNPSIGFVAISNSTAVQTPPSFDYASFILTWIWPLLAGVISSFMFVFLLYYLQKPKLKVSIVDDKYDGKSELHYVHLRVRNIRRPFLGGGTATNCKGVIKLQDGRSFVTKWATRLNPIKVQLVVQNHELKPISIIDDVLIGEAKIEYIRPREEKVLDVAVRMRGASSCYIHEPENFKVQGYRPEKNMLPAGEFPFTCVITYDGGESDEFQFKIINTEGESPGLLSLGQMFGDPRLNEKYFAYGSNMDPEQMEKRGAPFTEREHAVLKGFALKFNKEATGKNAKKGEGKGNVVCDPNGKTEGALYEITREGLDSLDDKELGYDRKELEVELGDGAKVKAWVYIAQPDKVREGLKPTREYLCHYLKGKDLLSTEYYRMLEKTQTLD